jgi:NTE family protein
MRKLRIGLALGSGAARGWSHIGVIRVLAEEGIHADVIAGTSMGALIGAALAAGRLETLAEWAVSLDWRGILGLLDVTLAKGGLIRGEEIIDMLASLGIAGNIENLEKPFVAVATDLVTGREIWLKEGDLGRAIHASIAMPGIFAPVRHGSLWLLDGGLVNPVPVSACRALGADVIIAVDLNGDLVGRHALPRPRGQDQLLARLREALPAGMGESLRSVLARLFPEENAPGYLDVLAAAINIMQDQITRSRLAGEPPHVLISPRLADFDLMDFDRAEAAIAEGEAAARRMLPHIRHVLARYAALY